MIDNNVFKRSDMNIGMTLEERIGGLASHYYKDKSWAHGWPHVQHMVQKAEILAPQIGVDLSLIKSAIYLHDVARENKKKTAQEDDTTHPDDAVSIMHNIFDLIGGYSGGISYLQRIVLEEAVTHHSDKFYETMNPIALLLPDIDKSEAMGAWGILRCIRHHFKEDFVDTQDILSNIYTPSVLNELARNSIEIIQKRTPDEKTESFRKRALGFVSEWVENMMMHYHQSYNFVSKDFAYVRSIRKQLFPGDVTLQDAVKTAELIEAASKSQHFRAHYFGYPIDSSNIETGLIAIDEQSRMKPHARSTDELIMCNSGKLASLWFDESGRVIRTKVLTTENPFIFLPVHTYHTILALEPRSSLFARIKGPYDKNTARKDLENAPNDDINTFNELKQLALCLETYT